jgi:hypothetical protein
MRKTTRLVIKTADEQINVTISHKVAGFTRDEAKSRHKHIASNIHEALSHTFYATDIKIQ